MTGIGVLAILCLVILAAVLISDACGWLDPTEQETCLEEARIETRLLRLAGQFNSEYEEDTHRQRGELRCRLLYPD